MEDSPLDFLISKVITLLESDISLFRHLRGEQSRFRDRSGIFIYYMLCVSLSQGILKKKACSLNLTHFIQLSIKLINFTCISISDDRGLLYNLIPMWFGSYFLLLYETESEDILNNKIV